MRIQNDPTTLDLLGCQTTGVSPRMVVDALNCVALLAPTGRILLVSSATVAVLGLDDETQLIGRHWCKTWPSWTHAALNEAVGRALRGEITTYWAQYPNPDGVSTDWDVRISPVFDDLDAVVSVLAVSRPVTKH